MSSIATVPPQTAAPTSTVPIPPPATSSSAPPLFSPTPDPGPGPGPGPDTSTRATASKRPGKTTTAGVPNPSGGVVGPPSGSPGSDGSNSNKGGNDSKSILAPVIGGVAAVLVVAFLVAVFVMRYRKKSRARKRRLDFLGDHGTTTAADHGGAGATGPAAGLGALAAGGRRPDSPQSRPSGAGNRPLEMAAVGGAAGLAGGAALAHHNKNNNHDGYDYQQGYQQVPYGGQYSEHQYDQPAYDQYDPYYSQTHSQPAGYYGDAQQQQQQQQQQQGYYNDQYTQNQFVPPAPVGHAGAGSSPSMTHATASPKSYPQPPPSTTTGGQSSPRTPQHVAAVPVPDRSSYDKNAKVENTYVGTHSAARNPQVMPQDEEKIKVPVQ